MSPIIKGISVVVALSLAAVGGCGPAKEKILEKAEKGIKKGMAAAFEAMDKNNDGKITKQEFAAVEKGDRKKVQEHFNQLDKDGNGVVTKREFMELYDKMMRGLKETRKETAGEEAL